MITLDVPLAWTPGEQTEVPVLIVYAIVTGSGLVVVLGTGLVAWWLHRRARRREAGLGRVPRPRGARRVQTAAAAPAETPDIDGPAVAGPIEVTAAASGPTVPAPRAAENAAERAAESAAQRAAGTRPTARRAPDPRWTNDASGEYVLLRAASARAQTVANQARHSSKEMASLLDTAERVYEEARQAHADALAAAPEPVPSNGSDAERDVARAALDAYRRGHLSAEELRKVWFGTSGWDARHEEAEQRTREFRAAEVQARQQYHIALAKARAARQAEYVADTAVRALGAETAAAATELAAEHDNARPRRGWLRNRSGAGAPAPAPAAGAPAG